MSNENLSAKTLRSLLLMFCLVFAGGGLLAGCQDQGPAEEAGEAIDDTMEDAGDAMDEAGDDIEDAVDD